ncbi:NAD(P)-dependent oxidoreductase [Xaviernesmea oryzae]|uniref:NAD(P)-dependent oxidoreductase n=1 Tax=Xaviernesmea oryzae TaxID=464029 RepID=A0A1Q9AUQ4_9HYPH|nr:SDR family NAD(P)-dependent oxidoreductase [Xaviernesmea oryzae]OLP59169.1 NAD(P)-dependent oxidoreductase [Xaviernesmea oryzae]SEK83386.1 Nucleoside-diphosphate-sugar epimerase [Xaviernesmea oryzae]
MHLLILGAGFSGRAIAEAFKAEGFKVTGTTRSPEKARQMASLGIEALVYDGENIDEDLRAAMRSATHLVQSIAPGPAGDPLMRPGMPALATMMRQLDWVGYLSTVGVYGDHGGAWVNEETACRPVSQRSRERVAAEEAWMATGNALDRPVAILRLAGIYGPGRNSFMNFQAGTARRLVKPGQVFNRIRVEDIADSTLFLAVRRLGGIYNVTDDEPAPPQDVVEEAARLMGIAPPPEIAFETAELSPMARSFYGENKRVSNQRLKQAGYRFRFPTYRQSLADLWESGRWRG